MQYYKLHGSIFSWPICHREQTVLYLKENVLYWPDDDSLRSKHVAIVNLLHTLYYYFDVLCTDGI